MISIKHPDGFSTVYAHNLRNAVKVGDRVEAGAVIGAVGRTGRATAYHLHLEVRRQGHAQNPLPLLERRVPGGRCSRSDLTAAEAAALSPRGQGAGCFCSTAPFRGNVRLGSLGGS